MLKKRTKRILGAAVGTTAAAGVLYLGFGNLLYNKLLTREAVTKDDRPKRVLEPATRAAYEKDPSTISDCEDWYAFIEPEEYTLVASTGETVHADVIKKEGSHRWAVVIHGWTNRPQGMANFAKWFHELGFNILLPHMRGHEKSENDNVSMGWYDRLEIIDWIKYLVMLDPDAEIILHGVSMGGATVMMITGEELPCNVKCAIEDCGYTSVYDMNVYLMGHMLHLPAFPFVSSANTVAKLRGKLDLKKASALDQVRKSKTPTLFIHGEEDDFVPYWMLDIVYDNASCEKERLSIPEAQHANAYDTAPELYRATVEKFIKKYIDL